MNRRNPDLPLDLPAAFVERKPPEVVEAARKQLERLNGILAEKATRGTTAPTSGPVRFPTAEARIYRSSK